MSITILVIGANGFLGTAFRELAQRNQGEARRFIFPSRQELDIRDFFGVERAFARWQPDFVINCAAFRKVDLAEMHREEAQAINVAGVKNLAQICRDTEAKLVHFSTQGVFDGKKSGPYVESDLASPINYYGLTKLLGEKEAMSLLPPEKLLILRISWPYGLGSNNFIAKILCIARDAGAVRVVSDEWGVPNPVSLLAEKTLEVMSEAQGLLHLSCSGYCSRYELISLIVQSLQISCQVLPVLSEEFPSKAPRPKNMAIATEREDWAAKLAMPSWKDALTQFLLREENV